ncbi:Uncharacterised protein [Vibrio cholerae]|nr:Uncharacterised protein [Vibrio cholerae]
MRCSKPVQLVMVKARSSKILVTSVMAKVASKRPRHSM